MLFDPGRVLDCVAVDGMMAFGIQLCADLVEHQVVQRQESTLKRAASRPDRDNHPCAKKNWQQRPKRPPNGAWSASFAAEWYGAGIVPAFGTREKRVEPIKPVGEERETDWARRLRLPTPPTTIVPEWMTNLEEFLVKSYAESYDSSMVCLMRQDRRYSHG